MFNDLIMSRNSEMFRQIASHLPVDVINYPDNYKYLHIIYLENDPSKIIHLHGSSVDIKRDDISFDELFHSVDPKTFSDCLLLLSLIGHISNQEIENVFQKQYNSSHLLTDVINDSNGVLVYKHHLEMLLTIFTKMNTDEVAHFRSNWNKKSQSVLSLSKDILINETKTLFDLIMERTPFENYPFFVSAVYKEAYLLYKFINNIK
jgi:hypothetical protein